MYFWREIWPKKTGVDDDQSRPDRRSLEGLESDEERDGDDRQHGLRQHHRCVVEGRQGRAAGFWELPDPASELAEGAGPENRVRRGRAAKAGAVLQGRKAPPRARQRVRSALAA